MADEIVFELLHSEIVNYALQTKENEKEYLEKKEINWPLKTKGKTDVGLSQEFPNVGYFLQDPATTNPPARLQETDLSVVEYIGFAAGYKVMERLTREWPRFKDELDTVKFICTDFWTCVYRKQIDNLRTNHQGVYVLQDNSFRFLAPFSSGHQYLEYAPRYVAYTCGLIRGGLANLCINSVVTAEVHAMPACKFHIHVQRT